MIDIMVIAAMQPGFNRPQYYGRNQEDTRDTVKVPRVWDVQIPEKINTCSVLISTPDDDLGAEEWMQITNVIAGAHEVYDKCLKPSGLAGRAYPGPRRKIFTSLEWNRRVGELNAGGTLTQIAEYVVNGTKLVEYSLEEDKTKTEPMNVA